MIRSQCRRRMLAVAVEVRKCFHDGESLGGDCAQKSLNTVEAVQGHGCFTSVMRARKVMTCSRRGVL